MTVWPSRRFGRSIGGDKRLGFAPGRIVAASLPGARAWPITTGAVLVLMGVIALADLLIWRTHAPYAVDALYDEPAHAATGLLALATTGVWFEPRVVLAVVAGSVLIDLDHIPHAFGSHVLEHGIPRPYTHSLGTILLLLLVARLLRDATWRRLVLIATLALALHFFRDMAEPDGPGLALLWPVSDHAFVVGYIWYGGAMLVLGAVALARRRGGSA